MWFKPAIRDYSQPLPRRWQDIPQGDWLREALESALAPHWETVFGHYLVKLGGLSAGLDTPCRIREQYIVSPQHSIASDEKFIRADLHALPLRKDSVDAVCLPFVLQYHENPHALLREVNRVLRADGHVVIAMTNPLSPGQFARILPKYRQQALWDSRLFTPQRVKDWLSLLHYEVIACDYFGAGVMCRADGNPEKGWRQIMQTCSWLQAGYFLVARKREWPLTPVRLRQSHKTPVRSGAVAVGRGMAKTS